MVQASARSTRSHDRVPVDIMTAFLGMANWLHVLLIVKIDFVALTHDQRKKRTQRIPQQPPHDWSFSADWVCVGETCQQFTQH